MLTEERLIAIPDQSPQVAEAHHTPVRLDARPEATVEHLLARLIVVGVGFGITLRASW
jgi:hypothetical protein